MQEIKTLPRDQAAMTRSQTSLVNQLIACLKASHPAALELFAKLHPRSTLDFLQMLPIRWGSMLQFPSKEWRHSAASTLC
jgi:hypothetical protein